MRESKLFFFESHVSRCGRRRISKDRQNSDNSIDPVQSIPWRATCIFSTERKNSNCRQTTEREQRRGAEIYVAFRFRCIKQRFEFRVSEED